MQFLNIDDKKDRIKFIGKLKDYLGERANKAEVDIKNMESKYFSSKSQEHIELINDEFGKLNLSSNTKEFIFARFVSSWFNASGKGVYTKNLSSIKKDISKLLANFSRLSSNISGFDLYKEIKEDVGYNSLKNIEKEYHGYNLLMLLEGLCGINQLINEDGFTEVITANSKSYKGFKEYFNEINKKINKKNSSKIPGMGITLLADAVKESGLVDVIKTDLHIVRVLNGVFNLGLKENPDSDNQYKKTVHAMYKLHLEDNDMTMYKLDKMIYLACSAFYLDGEKPNRQSTKRDDLISHILS